MSESFAELFEQSYVEAKMRPGTIMSATVVDINTNAVVVNAGLKSEGFIPIEQFYNKEGKVEIGVGDTVDVALDTIEDGFGETHLSREKAKQLIAWGKLEEAHKTGETVTGTIAERIKGGFAVNIDCIRAFLPRSLIDVRPVKDTSYLEDIPLEFKVIKIDRHRNNIVVSRRAVMETEGAAECEQLLDELKEGMVVIGIVKNLTDYGAFLDLGGVDGLLHITDMAWKRVKSPDEVVSIGDEIEVKILKFDRERGRISLGLKQMGEDPWTGLSQRYLNNRGAISGKVTNIADYGCFVEVEEGIEGLVHVSEMDWTNKNVHPSKLIHIGDMVDVVIIDIDEERRRISMSMKQCQSNPWTAFAASHKRNDRVTGIIKSITDFGIFVGLEGDIDGLIHLSDISWFKYDEGCLRNYKKGEEIETVILSIDVERERISLGIKQLEEDPFSSYIAKHAKGAVVTGIVSAVEPKLIIVKLGDQIEGRLRASELSLDKKIEDVRTEVKEGDELKLKITAIDRKKRTINVSVRAQAWDEEQAAIKEYTPNATPSAKLGDILKEHLE